MARDPRLEEERSASTIDKLQKARAERVQAEENAIENLEQFKMALNDVASTPNGAHVLKTLIKACGVFTPDTSMDAASLMENKARRNLYLQLIRPNLEPKLKQELEN